MTGRDLMSSELPAHLGLPQKGQTHDALADARALLAVLAHFEAPAVQTS
jgi:DNA polymerase III epsilon subunit-like protein